MYIPFTAYNERPRLVSMPRLPNSLKPKPSLSAISTIFMTPKPIEKRLTPDSLVMRQRLDELQGSLRVHAEHQQRVSDYLAIVNGVRLEGGAINISPCEGKTDDTIPKLTLNILDLLDQLVQEADQRLINNAAKEDGSKAPYGMLQMKVEAKLEVSGPHIEYAQSRFKLPPCGKIIEEETPPKSEPNRSTSHDAVVALPALDSTEGPIEETSEPLEESSKEFEPPLRTLQGVKALFETALGPRKINEHSPEIFMSEGEEKADPEAECQMSSLETSGEGCVTNNVEQQVSSPEVFPSFEDLYGYSPDAQSPIGQTKMSVTDKDGNDILIDDYYHHFLRKEVASKSSKRSLKELITPDPVQVTYSYSDSGSGDTISVQCALTKPKTSSTGSIGSYEISHDASDKSSTGKSYTTNDVLEPRQPPPVPMTRPPYRAGGQLAKLAAARAAGMTFPSKESLRNVLMSPIQETLETARKDSSESDPNGSAATIDSKKAMTPPPVPKRPAYRAGGRLAQLAAARAASSSREALINKVPMNPSTMGENSTTPGKEGGYSESTTNLSALPVDPEQEIKDRVTVSSSQGQCSRTFRQENAPEVDQDSAIGRYLAGPEASREDIIELSPSAANSLLAKGPKELRLLGLTLGDIFIDPHTGDFAGPDRTIGETNSLRKRYEKVARKKYENGELQMKSRDGEDQSLSNRTLAEEADSEKPHNTMTLFRRQHSHSSPAKISPDLLLRIRNASGPALFKVPMLKKRSAKPVTNKELNGDPPKKNGNIGAGMRRIFANNFGARSSTSDRTSSRPSTECQSEDGSIKLSISSTTHSDLSMRSTNQSSDADSTRVLPLSVNKQVTIESTTTVPRKLPSPPQPCIPVANQAVDTVNTSAKVTTGDVTSDEEPLDLSAFPLPPNRTPHKNRRIVIIPSSDNTTYAPSIVLPHSTNPSWVPIDVATLKLKRPQTGVGSIPPSRNEPDPDPFSSAPIRPSSREGASPSSQSSYAPSIVLPHPTNPSWIPIDVASLKLKRPQTGVGSIPPSRNESDPDPASSSSIRPSSRGCSRPPSRSSYAPSIVLPHPTNPSWIPIDVASLKLKRPQTGVGSIPPSRNDLDPDSASSSPIRPSSREGSRPSSQSSSRSASENSMRAVSRSEARAMSRMSPPSPSPARLGSLTRTNGVPNLRHLQQPPPKMGPLHGSEGHPHLRRAVRMHGGGIIKSSLAPNQILARKNSRLASRTIPTNAQQHLQSKEGRTYPKNGSRFINRNLERPNPRTNEAVIHRDNRGVTTPPPGNWRTTSPTPLTDEVQNEWLVRDIPLGNKVPPPHLMSSPGGRYPKPFRAIGEKNKQITRGENDAQDKVENKRTGGFYDLDVTTENWVNYGREE